MHDKRVVGMQLHKLSNMTKRYVDNTTHKNYVDSMTGTNTWILVYMSHNTHRDIFQRDLEETFGITRSTVSKVINLMVQKGLIERSPVEYDARLKKLTLTEKSLELIAIMHEDNMKMETTLTRGFSEEEKALLLSYFERMQDNIRSAAQSEGMDIEEEIKPFKGGKK